MIIEIVGPPGAGKSTVRDYLVEKLMEYSLQVKDSRLIEKEIILNRYNIDCESGWRDCYLGKSRLYSSIFTGSTYLHSIIRNPLEYISRPKRLGLYWFAKDIVLSSYYQHTGISGGYHYFSNEGLLQHLVSIRVFANKEMDYLYQQMVKKIDMNSILVVRVLINPDVGLQRLVRRGIPDSWPFYYRTTRRLKLYNDRYNKKIGELMSQLEERNVKVFEIDVNNSWEKVKTMIDVKCRELVPLLKSLPNI